MVARVDFGGCLLQRGDGALAQAVVSARLLGPRRALGNTVVVGDRVRVAREGGRATVIEVEPRRNAFSRRAAGERAHEQVVAANLDQIVVVGSIVQPEFRPGLADRVLCQAGHAGIPARLVINKRDLAEPAAVGAVLEAYARAGYAVHAVSARLGDGVAGLREACRGVRSLFIGHSGVGKSTLLSALAPGIALLAGQVNPKTGKGRHTTTAAWLLRPEPGFEVIDTPGVRAFGLWGIDPHDLAQAYPELRDALGRCRFGDCRHEREPGCALRAASEAGVISERRWASYRKLHAELVGEAARATARG